VTSTLLASALLALATAAGFATVGVLVLRRRAPSLALVSFGVFWWSAAGIWADQGVAALSGALGFASFPLLRMLDELATPLYCVASASLLFFVLYLLTGKHRALGPILAYYLALWAALRYHVAEAAPGGFEVRAWQVNVTYAAPLQGMRYTILIALMVLPLLAAIAAYGSLVFRLQDAGARYRIACVAADLIVWVTTEALSYTTGAVATTEGELTRRIVALGSTLVMMAGYIPPRFARQRWGAVAAFDA
jgi:hypothetical protein